MANATAADEVSPKAPQSASGTSSSENEKPSATTSPTDNDKNEQKAKEPAGGYDSTPIPYAPAGYTVKITFVRANALPIADLNSLSSDPYVLAQLNTALPDRHKDDPPLRFRTHTIRKKTDPVWNSEWIVANLPASGFKLKARVYDEDPADHDDRLGNVHVNIDRISDDWEGFQERTYAIKKRMGSKRAYVVRAIATCVGAASHMHGELVVSVEVLGRTKDESGGRAYTVGPCWWVKHYSPMLGRMTGMKEDQGSKPDDQQMSEKGNDQESDKTTGPDPKQKKKKKPKSDTQRYNFQANKLQLPGPVPAELYHRYVEFKPFVKGMFTRSGLRGFVLNKALHHQHARVYSYDRSTMWGLVPTDDPQAITKRFLEFVHYDKGGRIFTYVLTLDGQLRFTETGKEFGIDMLSKHSMHSDVSAYIAFSGEFFLRRYRPSNRRKKTSSSSPSPSVRGESRAPAPSSHSPSTSRQHLSPDPHQPVADSNPSASKEEGAVTNANQTRGGKVEPATPVAHETTEPDVALDPHSYELIIDNDSGTYRPAAHLLPLLRTFMSRSLPGLHVRTLDCQKDADRMAALKDGQRERKKEAQGGATVVFTQRSRSGSFASSVSSSDEEELDRIAGAGTAEGERRFGEQAARELEWKTKKKVEYWKGKSPRRPRTDGGDDEEGADDEKKQKEVGEDADSGEQGGEEKRGEEEGQGRDGSEIDEDEITKDAVDRGQGVHVSSEGTAMNQGQTIGTSDRHPEHHVHPKRQGEGEEEEGEEEEQEKDEGLGQQGKRP